MIEIISIVSILLVAFSAYLGSIGFKGKISTIGKYMKLKKKN